jgi:thioredoxin-like negative regulator of GroEL
MLEKIAANSKGMLRLAKLNVDKHPEARRRGPEPFDGC